MGPFNWFQFWIFVLSSLSLTTEQSQLISSPQPITAKVGDDVILPCRLDPPVSASSRAIEWTKPGLDPDYIHVHQDGRLVHQSQNPLFKYRTTLFVDQLINGNVSLKLSRVKNSDAGRYRCFIPSLWKEAFVHLSVGEKAEDGKEVSSVPQSNNGLSISILVLLVLLIILSVVQMFWICQGNKIEWKMCRHNKDGEAEERELLSKEMEKALKEELQRDRTQVIETLRGLTKDLEKQMEQLTSLYQGAEKQAEETDEKIRLVVKDVEEKGGDKTANKAQGYLKLRELFQEVNWNQEERKKELQQLHMNIEQLMKKTVNDVNRITENNTVESRVEQIKKQIEEMEN